MFRSNAMPKKILPDPSVCIGCRLCEIHCAAAHSASKDLVKTFKRDALRPLRRVRVEEKGAVSFALQCRNCEEPACVFACISGAMHRTPDGSVRHDPDRCVGCWSCIMVCPYGAIARDERAGRVASKCDLCVGRDTPACVENCPNRALSIVEDNK
jgi:anaerobic carbon-monoxide dehydrogenase iron sulfur subunit